MVNEKHIISQICNYLKLDPEWLTDGSRERYIVDARQIAMYLIRKHTDNSFPMIGQLFNRSHSTVIHSCKKVKEISDVNKRYKALIMDIERSITNQ